MGVDDSLAERDVGERVFARGKRRAPAGDAVVEMDQLLLETLSIGNDLLVTPSARRRKLAAFGLGQGRHAAQERGGKGKGEVPSTPLSGALSHVGLSGS
jgi:hypothetical protein